MERKKIIIFSLVASLLIVTAFSLFSYNQSKNKKSSETDKKQNKTVIEVPYSQSTDTIFYYVQDENSKVDVKKAFDEYTKNKLLNKEDIVWSKIVNKDKKEISIDNFSQAVGIKINDKIRELLMENNYDLISQNFNEGGKYGIVLEVNLFDNYTNLYPDEVSFMKIWEASILEDMRNVLFPGKNFSQEKLGNKVEFKDGKDKYGREFRYAKINQSDSVYYELIDDYIIIASSEAFINKVSVELISAD